MNSVKQIELNPIDSKSANEFVRKHHYSGKVVNNSQLHIGAFWKGRLEGVMSFGPSLDKRKVAGLVRGTGWNEFIELNRMAFTDVLPRNSESRCIAVALRLLKKHAPHLKWIISFADATQCGDGTIYRASGFILTGIKKNNQIWIAPDADGTGDETCKRLVATDTRRPEYYRLQEKARHARESRMSLTDNRSKNEQAKAQKILSRVTATKGKYITHSIAARRGYGELGGMNLRPSDAVKHSASLRPGIGAIGNAGRTGGGSSMKAYIEAGFRPLEGFQLRYVYFLDPSYRSRLTVPEVPFSEIEKRGAAMYKGKRVTRALAEGETGGVSNTETGGANPTNALMKTKRKAKKGAPSKPRRVTETEKRNGKQKRA